MKNLEVPFYSQNNDEIPEEKQRQLCGLCCVKMILDFYNPDEENNILDLIKEAELIEAFDKQKQIWSHEGLVRVMRNHGVLAYAQEFRSVKVDLQTGEFLENENQKQLLQKGVEKIIFRIKKGYPIIASMREGFGTNTDSHLVVIKGFKKADGISLIINDPLDGPDMTISLDYFLEFWRKFVIFSR